MPYPAKTNRTQLLALKIETTYGTYSAPSLSTDVKLLAISDRFQGLVKKGYLYDGVVGPSSGSTGYLPRIPKQGPFFDAEFPFRFRGAGAAYAAGVKSSIHDWLLLCGFSATGSFTASNEKWTFDPTPDGTAGSSASYLYYKGGQVYQGAGCLGALAYETQGGAPPLLRAVTKAIQNADVTDSTPGAATYTLNSVVEPGSFGNTMTIGSLLAANCRSVKFESGTAIDTARPNMNGATTHLGYVLGEWNPKVTFVIERTAFVNTPFHTSAGIDYYKLAEAATQIGLAHNWGSVQYNRAKVNYNNAQLADINETNDGPVATVELTWEPKGANPGAYDFMSVVTD